MLGAGLHKDKPMNAQTSQIDGVTGATVTSKAVQNAVADCIQQASGGAINPAQQSTEETSSTADWLGEAPEIAESDIKQTVDCEVLVVGAGSSGSFAAAAAAEAGAKTILIEKFGHDMASGIRDTLAACGSKQQQEDGDDVSKKDAVCYLCNWSQGYTRRSLAQVWADKSGETMDWFTDVLAESGIDFRHEIDEKHEGDNYEVLDVGHSTQYGEEYSEQLTMDAVLKHAEADGLEVQYEITMVKLEKDGDRVTGLIAKNANDEYVRYNASKGVILATGDNSGDEKIMKHFAPEIVEKKIANMGAMGMLGVDVEGKTVETGDGLRMGAWIGAKVQDFHAPMTHHMGSGMGVTPFLQINKRGDRFMNECIPGQQLENQIELQPECTSFQLYDSKWGEEVPYMPANHGGLCYIIPEDEDESNPNYTDRQYTKISAKAEAYQFKADTLEDLLTQCGFEGDALDNALASVERYNELAKAGSDDDFGKPASRMFALENPPYYACQWGTTSMLVCVGGLESDENCHTFTEEDPASPKRDIIKGLYVCGNVQGSRYAVEYPICMRGISHSLCVYYGYIAGKNCVAGV